MPAPTPVRADPPAARAEPLLEIRGLRKEFRESRRQRMGRLVAVDGVDLRIGHGEIVGLVGESGCGKSTLARCVVGLEQPTAGEIRFRGVALGGRRSAAQRRMMQMVFQDPYASLNPVLTVGGTLREILKVHGLVPPARREERCRELLRHVGLDPGVVSLLPRQFSGGERQRIALARALAVEPELLVADEPASALDVSVQATVVSLLMQLRRDLNLSMLFIAHSLPLVRQVCDRVAVMYLGRIVEVAETEALFDDPRHPYTRALMESVPGRRRERSRPALTGETPSQFSYPSGCPFAPRCAYAEERCLQTVPDLLPVATAGGHACACHLVAEGLLPEAGPTP